MARTARNQKLDTRSARSKLPLSKSGYWTAITRGCALGYRKGAKGSGTWLARAIRPDVRRETALGAADDFMDANGTTILDYGQAQRKAREWFSALDRLDEAAPAGPYTVDMALDEYLTDYQRRGGKALHEIRNRIEAFIRPAFGKKLVAKLTTREIRAWHEKLAQQAPRLRTRKSAVERNVRAFDPADPEALRRRRVSSNRKLTTLKAALNHAFAEGRIASDDAWRRVKPFRNVERARVRYLTIEEARRLVNGADPAFRPMVQAGLLTGCRYAELTKVRVRDFNPEAKTLHIADSKSGHPRHVILTEDGAALCTRHSAGKRSDALLFPRPDGQPWGKSHQHRRMKDACEAASISPAVSFHILRHSYASHLIMRGTPLMVVGANLGHADTRMVERHYGHLAPSYIAEMIRANMPALDILETTNLRRLGTKTEASGSRAHR